MPKKKQNNKSSNKGIEKNNKKVVKEEVKEEVKEDNSKTGEITRYTVKHKIIEILLYLTSYTITFMIVQNFFRSFVIAEPKLLYSIIAVVIIYVLNKVVKPIIVTLTMPITGITFGLFYIIINTLILVITDLVMFSKLDFTNIWILFFISIILSILRFLIEDIILKPIVRKAFKE